MTGELSLSSPAMWFNKALPCGSIKPCHVVLTALGGINKVGWFEVGAQCIGALGFTRAELAGRITSPRGMHSVRPLVACDQVVSRGHVHPGLHCTLV